MPNAKDCLSVSVRFYGMEDGASSTKAEGFLSRMALNDNKAGMEGLDRDKINKIIMESSKVGTANPLVLHGTKVVYTHTAMCARLCSNNLQ